MKKHILKIYTDEGLDDNNPTFHDLEITTYSFTRTRMGLPELSGSVKHKQCLDSLWTGKEYVVYDGQKYYIRHTPDSKKTNSDSRYEHSITFNSEASEILPNTYFYDTVYFANSDLSASFDKPCSNSSTFTFYGTIREFIDRLNCSFRYRGIGDSILERKTTLTTEDTPAGDGFCAMLDPYGAYDPSVTKEISAEDSFLWDIITNGYEAYEIPFELRGKTFIFGRTAEVVDHTFEYGHNNELLTISKVNANAKVINNITFKGSSENIPYYYPNETEYGHIELIAGTPIGRDKYIIRNISQLLSAVPPDTDVYLMKDDATGNNSTSSVLRYLSVDYRTGDGGNGDLSLFKPYTFGERIKYEPEKAWEKSKITIRLAFGLDVWTRVRVRDIVGTVWQTNSGIGINDNYYQPIKTYVESLYDEGYNITSQVTPLDDNGYDLGVLGPDTFELLISFDIPTRDANGNKVTTFSVVDKMDLSTIPTEGNINTDFTTSPYYWWSEAKSFRNIGELGLELTVPITDNLLGANFRWTTVERLAFQTNLMPPKYSRAVVQGLSVPGLKPTEERFYKALNDTYIDPDTGKHYVFDNPYNEGAPSEYIYVNEDIKPTIEGVTNSKGELLGEIVDVAFDSDDNDSLKADSSDNDKTDALKYQHSFFYIKLHVFDGTYGFDLFKSASQAEAMTIQMRSGSCNGCKFKVQAVEFTDSEGLQYYKNPVRTDSDGNIVYGTYADKVKDTDFQDWQQNTQTNSIWICLQKDASTFGQILPSKINNFIPKRGDLFNIINIQLPQGYISAAEDRGEAEMLRYMADNNEEKFTFNISASRIFFAENPDVLAALDEYSRLKIKYDGHIYTQYIDSITIDYKSEEPLPNIQITLSEELTASKSFEQRTAERASSLIANATTRGGYLGGGTGTGGVISAALAEKRYLNKQKNDRSPYKIASDMGFEVGEFSSGTSGGLFGYDYSTGRSFLELDELRVRMRAIFETLQIVNIDSIGGKLIISPGGSSTISIVEDRDDVWRCYFKAKDEDKGAECRFKVGDLVRCEQFNITDGTSKAASNRFYWRRIGNVDSENAYFDILKSEGADGSTYPMAGDVVCQLGSKTDKTRQSAIVLSTVDAFSPMITLYHGIDDYNLNERDAISYGVDKTYNPPRPFFHCYGDMYLGNRDGSAFLKYTPEDGLEVKGKISVQSKLGDKGITDYISDEANKAASDAKKELEALLQSLQNQVDGVVETYSFPYTPTLSNYPANTWTTDADKIAHLGDVFFNIEPYENADGTTNPDAGKAWRWTQSDTDSNTYHWHPIADSDAVKALQLASLSVLDTDVLFIQTSSNTTPPALPSVNSSGTITALNGWATTAPTWQANKYIWQTTYVRRGDGSAAFSDPTCISGRNGVDGTSITITSQSVTYSTVHTATKPAETTFTLTSIPNLSEGDYLWSRTLVKYSNGQSTDSYAVSRIGVNGQNGQDGKPGTNGTSVTITSKSVTYAVTKTSNQPADAAFTFTSIASANVGLGDYLWTKTEVVYSDSNSTKSYSVSRIGSDGQNGQPGQPGADGKTTYVHYAYANSADGATDFSTTYFTDALYVGICTDFTAADPTTYTAYTWSRLRGENGADGRGIVSIVEEYAINNSDTTPPADSSFSTVLPTMTAANPYLWNREKTSYSDNTSNTSNPLLIGVRGQNGQNGKPGEDGATVTKIVNYYLASANATGVTTITPGWVTDPQNAQTDATNPYLWNYEVTSWSKGADTFTTPHVVGKYGVDGVGIVSIEEEYYLSTSRDALVGGSWQATRPAWVAGHYYWVRTKITYTEGPVEYTDGICVTGETGAAGASVIARYSEDGTSWHLIMQANDVWMQTSADNGITWSTSVRIRGIDGADGTSYTPNLLLGTSIVIQNDNYDIARYDLVESIAAGTDVTITIWGLLGADRANFAAFNSGGYVVIAYLNKIADGVYSAKCQWVVSNSSNTYVQIWNMPSSGTYPSRIEKIKLEYGHNDNPIWTPAIQEMEGKYKTMQWAKNTSTTTAPTSGWSDSPITALSGEYVWMRTGWVVPPATTPTVWDSPAIRLTGDKGVSGESTYLLDLSDEFIGISCDSNGNPINSYPSTYATVYKGSTAVAHSSVKFTLTSTNIASIINHSNGQIAFSNMAADTASVTVQAVVDGITLQATVNLSKVKNGANGAPGAASTVYTFEPSVNTVTRSFDGTLTPVSINVTKFSITGNNPKTWSSYGIIRHQFTYEDGTQSAEIVTVPEGSVEATIAIPINAMAIIFTLYDGTTGIQLDRERIPVVTDARDLEVGGRNLIEDSNRIVVSDGYPTQTYYLYEDMIVGEEYTVTIWGRAGTGVQFTLFLNDGYIGGGCFTEVEPGIYKRTVTIPSSINVLRRITIFCTPYQDPMPESKISRIKMERGNVGTDYTPAPEDLENRISELDYIKAALAQNTTINGGLILTSLISLGYYNEETDTQQTYSGISGLYDDSKYGKGIFLWGGGRMVDYDDPQRGENETPAKFAFRMDGTGYAANHTIRFEDGLVSLGDNVKLNNSGLRLIVDGEEKLIVADDDIGDETTDITSGNKLVNDKKTGTISLYQSATSLPKPGAPASASNPIVMFMVQSFEAKTYTIGTLSAKSTITATINMSLDFNSATINPDTGILISRTLSARLRVIIYRDGNVEYDSYSYFSQIGPEQYGVTHELVFTTSTAGNYSIYIMIPDSPSVPAETTSSYNFAISASASVGFGSKTILGNNGLRSSWGNAALLVNTNGVYMKCGNYAFRVTSSGIQKSYNGGSTWTNI